MTTPANPGAVAPEASGLSQDLLGPAVPRAAKGSSARTGS